MDYYQGSIYLRIIALVSLLAICICEPSDRDIILTPKQSSQVKGKSLYYRSIEDLNNEPGVRVPWERVLKHLTYITLYGMPNEQNKLDNDNVDYKRFMNASYDVQTNQIVTNFGDIITLAEGRVEKPGDNEFRFIEGKCTNDKQQKCNDKHIIAQWQVQKIRHRDDEKKFRYEIKFSIDRYEPEESSDKAEARDGGSGKRVTRAFILRDIDYPDSFLWLDQHVSQRRIDENRRYLERLHRFNEVFSQPVYIDSSYYTSDNPLIPQLNFGEFLREPIHRREPVYSQFIPPTTYRPKYHVKFAKPSLSYEVPIERDVLPIKSPVMTYNQQGYYDNEKRYEELTKQYNQQNSFQVSVDPSRQPPFEYVAQTPSPIKQQIPIPPNIGNHLSQTPVPIQLTSPIIQSPAFLYPQYPESDQQYFRNIARKAFDSLQNFNVPQYHQLQHIVPSAPSVQQYQQVQQVAPSVQPLLYNFQSTANPIQQSQEYLQEITPTRPFVESPKLENDRYSEPDPLYKNRDPAGQLEEQSVQWQAAVVSEREQNVPQQEPPNEQQSNIDEHVATSKHDEPVTDSTEGLKTSSSTYPSVFDENQNVENPSEIDQNTEQNQLNENEFNTKNNLQVPAPESGGHEQSTSSYAEPIHTSPPNDIEVPVENQQRSPDFPAEIQKPVSSVEVTHWGEPKDPPVVHVQRSKQIITEKIPHSTTTQRSLSSAEGVFTSNAPRANSLNTNDITQVTKAIAHFKTSSERPVLKWKPKRQRTKTQVKSKNGSDTTIIIAKTRRITQRPLQVPSNHSDIEIERVPDEDTVQKIFRLKPTTESGKGVNASNTDSPLSTKQSYSTSISIKVGSQEEVPYPRSVSLPNLELFKARLEPLNTNSTSIKFFKASDKNEKPGEGDETDRIITRSIVKHATSLDT